MSNSIPQLGVLDVPPLREFPAGRVRLKLRNDKFAVAYVRPPNGGIRAYHVEIVDGYLQPLCEIAANADAHERSSLTVKPFIVSLNKEKT